MTTLLLTSALGGLLALAPSATLEKNIRTAIDDEFESRAYYTAVSKAHDRALPYDHLRWAEGNHAQALANLLRKNGWAPQPDSYAQKPGESLASWSVRLGVPKDLESARLKAIRLENENVAMYDRFLAEAPPADASVVFNRLQAVSRDRHLVALNGACPGNAPMAGGTCCGGGPGMGMGMGAGRGQGQGMGNGAGTRRGQGAGPGGRRVRSGG